MEQRTTLTQDKGKKNIIIIEDDAVLAGLLDTTFKKNGYEIIRAGNESEGYEKIRSHKPDCTILDMSISEKEGFTFLEMLHKEGVLPGLPIVVIFDTADPSKIERIKKLGVKDYFVQLNFDLDTIFNSVERILMPEKSESKSILEREGSVEVMTGELGKLSIGKNGNILLIEDDPLLSRLLERKFEVKDYKVFRVIDADEARAVLKENDIDLIALDIIIPGLNGFGFLKELKSDPEFQNIPVVVVSNLSQQDEIEKGLASGAEDYLIKSNLTPSEIVQKIESYIKK